jgi:hypothetical protein
MSGDRVLATGAGRRAESLYTHLMAKPAHPHPDKLLLYEKLVATNSAVELKGATVPYTSINGNMSSYLSKEGKLALRLPAEDIEAFLKKYKAQLCEAYGVVQKEYVEAPDALLAKDGGVEEVFRCQCRICRRPQAEGDDEKEGEGVVLVAPAVLPPVVRPRDNYFTARVSSAAAP